MLEQFLRARLPEQIVALIENLEQNPDASHLEKVLEFASRYGPDITTFENWMLARTVRKVRKLVKRDELLRGAMAIVINAPEEKTVRYDPNTFMISTGTTGRLLAQQAQNTWIDSKSLSSASNKLY
jgi:hypothetical protein